MTFDLPILVADDDAAVRSSLRIFLKAEGLDCVLVASPEAALAALAEREFGALLADMNYRRDTTSGAEGLGLIAQAAALDPQLPIVAMTAWGTVALAVEAMRGGASDFIEKPWDNHRLMTIIRSQLALGEAKSKTKKLERENEILRGDDADFIARFWAESERLVRAGLGR